MELYYYTTLKEKSKEGFEDMIRQAGQTCSCQSLSGLRTSHINVYNRFCA